MEQTDPERERLRLSEVYSEMTEEQLEELAAEWESLTGVAQLALKQEVERRGLQLELEEQRVPGEAEFAGELVTIREFESPGEARLVKDLLESGGIRVSLLDVHNQPLDSTGPAFGRVSLQVRPEEAEIAKEFLDSLPQAPEGEP
jgi:hypothetical protein